MSISLIHICLGPSVCHLRSRWGPSAMCPGIKESRGCRHQSLPCSDLVALGLRSQVSFAGTLVNALWIKFLVSPHLTVFGVLSFGLMSVLIIKLAGGKRTSTLLEPQTSTRVASTPSPHFLLQMRAAYPFQWSRVRVYFITLPLPALVLISVILFPPSHPFYCWFTVGSHSFLYSLVTHYWYT